MSSKQFNRNTPTAQPAAGLGRPRQPVTIELTADAALVLFDWLTRTSQSDAPLPFDDPAEQQVLWDLEGALEQILVEPFRSDYRTLLHLARRAVRLEHE